MEQRRDQQQGRQQQQQQGMDGSSLQQGGQNDTGQQRQFDSESSGQQGGATGNNRFAEDIREHMEVVDQSGRHCGTVDHIQGDQIKLSRKDSSDGQHHYVQLSDVAGIEGDKVRLR